VFLSGVRSRSHLVYVSAYLRHLLARPGVGRVTVVNLGLGAFLGVDQVSPADVSSQLALGEQISTEHATGAPSWRGEPGEALVYLAVGAPGIKPYLRLLLANRRALHRVVVDEGLGSYGGWRSRWAAGRRQGGRGPTAALRAVAVTSSQRLLTDERWALYRHSAVGWQADARIASEFRARLPLTAGGGGDVVVLMSQPWVELGQLSAQRYLAVLDDARRACAAAGLTLLVRPHSAEDRARYVGLPLQGGLPAGQGPAEMDRDVVDAAVVLGFNSTALINLAAVHGTPVLRLALPELADVEASMSPAQRSLLAAFVPGPIPIHALTDWLRAHVPRLGPTMTSTVNDSAPPVADWSGNGGHGGAHPRRVS
jgi:hypothetical protein